MGWTVPLSVWFHGELAFVHHVQVDNKPVCTILMQERADIWKCNKMEIKANLNLK